jgi:23S rRNA (guanosine2251-2'-O)-methyltransferase
VREVLRAGRWPLEQLLAEEGSSSKELDTILRLARDRHVRVERVPREQLDALEGRHQGLAARAGPFPYADLESTVAASRVAGREPFLVLLAGIQDPRNLGAILRTAVGAGVTAVVLPRRDQVGITGAVARTSAGAIAWVPVARVPNLNASIRWLRRENVWVFGASERAPRTLYQTNLRGAVALVIGGEGGGLRRLTAELCDELVAIPQAGPVGSLNASVAAGILMYEVHRQRQETSP